MSQNVFSDEAFAAWLAKQPADGKYPFLNDYNCAVTQYMRATGLRGRLKGRLFPIRWYWDTGLHDIELPRNWMKAAQKAAHGIAFRGTWGECLSELKKLMANDRVREKIAA